MIEKPFLFARRRQRMAVFDRKHFDEFAAHIFPIREQCGGACALGEPEMALKQRCQFQFVGRTAFHRLQVHIVRVAEQVEIPLSS